MQESLIISHLEAAQSLLNSVHGGSIRFVISFGDPGTKVPENLYAHDRMVLRLECHDLSPEATFTQELCYPNRSHVHKLISFSKLIEHNMLAKDLILFHCYGGIARSPAAAAIFLKLNTSMDTEEIYETIMRLRPCAEPNFYLLQYADQILRTSLLEVFRAHRKVGC